MKRFYSLTLCLFVLLPFSAMATTQVNGIPGKYVTQLNNTAAALLQVNAKPALSLQQANRLFQQSRFKPAYQALLPWAQTGNRMAQLEVGFLYEFGKGVSRDYPRAAQWYYLAVIPYDYNQKPLARAFKAYYGIGEKVDYREAARWFRMSAELSVDKY